MTMGGMHTAEVRSARSEVRGAKGDLRKERSPHPAPRTPHVFTYRRVVQRLVRGGAESAALDAACLMEAASGIPRWRFILEPERLIALETSDLLESMLSRREAREPIAYILGVKEFWSLPLAVCREVLIPRPETETLVEAALKKISFEFRVPSSEFEGASSRLTAGSANPKPETRNPKLSIADVGTGCGAIALALAMEIPHGRIYALDRFPGALRVAQRNAEALGLAGRVHFVQGDLLEPLRRIQGGRGFDLIVSNPPYIPSDALAALPAEIAVYEPREALDGGPDGLHYHRRIIEAAPGYLCDGGWLALEVGDGQAPAVIELIRGTEAFGPVEGARDLGGHDRVVLAPRKATANG